MALREVLARFGIKVDGANKLSKTGSSVERLTASLGKLGVAFGVGIALRATKDFISDIITVGDELDKTSQVTGLSVKSLQAWRAAADLSGVSSSEFTSGLLKFSKNIFEASKGTALQAEAFSDLGVSIEDGNGKLRNSGDVLFDVITAMQGLESQTEKAGQASRLFGRTGLKLLPLLNLTGEELKSALGELEKYGGGLTEVSVQMAAQAQDSITRYNLALESLKGRIAIAVLPVIDKLIMGLTTLIGWWARVAEKTNIVKAAILAAGLALSGPLAAGLKAALVTVGPFILKFAILALVLDDILTFFEGGESVIGDAIDAIFGEGSQEKVRKFAGEVAKVEDNLDGLIAIGKQDVLEGLNARKLEDLDQPLARATFKVKQFYVNWRLQNNTIPGILSKVTDAAGDWVKRMIKSFGLVGTVVSAMASELIRKIGLIPGAFVAMVVAIPVALFKGITAIKNWVRDSVKALTEAPALFLASAKLIGQAIVDGIVETLEAAADKIIDAMTKPVKDAVKKVKEFIKPGSPSKVFTKIFKTVPEGMVAGMRSGERNVERQITRMTNRVVNITGANINQRFNNNVTVPGASSPVATANAVSAKIGKRDRSGLEAAFNSLVDLA